MGLEGAMVKPVSPNHDLPLVPSKEVLGVPQLVHVLDCGPISYRIFVHFLQVGGGLFWYLGRI